MSLQKSDLLTEQANLEQQLAQCEDGIAAADRVRQDNVSRKEAVNGAMQLVKHLVAKIEKQDSACTETAETDPRCKSPEDPAQAE